MSNVTVPLFGYVNVNIVKFVNNLSNKVKIESRKFPSDSKDDLYQGETYSPGNFYITEKEKPIYIRFYNTAYKIWVENDFLRDYLHEFFPTPSWNPKSINVQRVEPIMVEKATTYTYSSFNQPPGGVNKDTYDHASIGGNYILTITYNGEIEIKKA